MTTSTTQVTSASSAAPANPPIPSDHAGVTFHDILSALNPLQYLPVVGTIYRAATGDVIPEPLRRLGSLLVSGLMGGPVGVVISLAMTIAEKITGLDPEKTLAAVFNSAAPPKIAAAPEAPTISPASAISPASNISPTSTVAPTPSDPYRLAMSPAQLAAYGVRVDASGTLRLGDIRGADVLNAIELARHAKATAAYTANQSWAHG
jgi:hypothetical protein